MTLALALTSYMGLGLRTVFIQLVAAASTESERQTHNRHHKMSFYVNDTLLSLQVPHWSLQETFQLIRFTPLSDYSINHPSSHCIVTAGMSPPTIHLFLYAPTTSHMWVLTFPRGCSSSSGSTTAHYTKL